MENTHVTIGGHKVTTNKVGQVHTITTGFLNSHSGKIVWSVTNGICVCVLDNVKRSATTGWLKVYSGLPKAKHYVYNLCTLNILLNVAGTDLSLYYAGSEVGVGVYDTIIYPVADDWVES